MNNTHKTEIFTGEVSIRAEKIKIKYFYSWLLAVDGDT